MLAHRVFDHRLVGRDDERSPRGEHEQPDGFERFNRGVGQAAVQVVDQDNELLDARVFQKLVECLAECFYFLRNVPGFARLQHRLCLVDGGREVFFRRKLARVCH